MSGTTHVNQWFDAIAVHEDPALIQRSEQVRVWAPTFARATSRRGRALFAAAFAALVIAAVWAVGAWMTGNVARALGAVQRAEASCGASVARGPQLSCAERHVE